MFILFIKPKTDGYIPEFQDFNLLQFNLIKTKAEQNALLNIGNILAEEIILTKIHIMEFIQRSLSTTVSN